MWCSIKQVRSPKGACAYRRSGLWPTIIEADTLLELTAAVEAHSRHPLAEAIVSEANRRLPACDSFRSLSGQGVTGSVAGNAVAIGNLSLMRAQGIAIAEEMITTMREIEAGMGIAVCIAVDRKLVGLIHLQDKPRAEAAALIAALRHRGIGMSMLTGDSVEAARALATSLGGLAVAAGLSPERKEEEIRKLQAGGERVLMIGDGVNDAPALARADVSMAMGSGMDVSKASADIVLVASDLSRVGFAIVLAGKTLSAIRQNITISLLYNLILVPMAMAAMVTPLFAAIAMPISSMLVIGNALLIRRRVRGQSPVSRDAGVTVPISAT